MLRAAGLSLLFLLPAAVAARAADPAPQPDAAALEFFESKVRPLLVERCFECHGPEAKEPKGGLRLDSRASLLKGGDTGPAIVPGRAKESLLVDAVNYGEIYQMPPKSKLPAEEIALLTRWVEIGAPWPDEAAGPRGALERTFNLEQRKAAHWAWQPLAAARPPAVANSAWPRQPLDRFILEKLEAAGLTPAASADKRTWIRRVSFDLTGLPPTPAEAQAFLADESPDAFATVVDRLLQSDRFGERWARHWLDLVRYAETRGHEFDYTIPNAWQYRDYVIRAFNADVPYNRFVMEHVAGDLLSPSRLHPQQGFNESILGTGFWYLSEEVHSPVDIRGDETDRIDNKIDVLSKAFLGLTVACARCHDHKFDAIGTKDYYALAGFLLGTSYRQVPFESLEHNARVFEQLQGLRRRQQPVVARAVAEAARPTLENLADYLLAARDALRLGPAAAEAAAEAALPADADILFEDFERDDYGGWTVTGTAFGKSPIVAARMPAYQGDVQARGMRLVNSHNTRGGEDVTAGDAHTGTLTSPAFRIERDFVHFLIGGGSDKDGTCVNLVIDNKPVLSATGRNDNRLQPQAWDVRQFRGRIAQIEVVDRLACGWGNIGLDHIVFSNRGGAEALDVLAQPEDAAGWRRRAEELSAERGLDPRLLVQWIAHLRQAADLPDDPLHAWALVSGAPVSGEASPIVGSMARLVQPIVERAESKLKTAAAALKEGTVIVDYAAARPGDWQADGYCFGNGPLLPGGLRYSTDPAHPIAQVCRCGAAQRDPLWDVLELAAGTERELGRLSWLQAGRTLRTPTFTLSAGKVYYLVKGSGYAYAAVDSHRMNNGPLHGALIREWKSNGQSFQWIEHDLSPYAGHRLHVEFSPREAGQVQGDESPDLAVRMVVLSDRVPGDPDRPNRRVQGLLQDPQAVASAEKLALGFQGLFLNAAERLANDQIAGHEDAPDCAALADWLVGHAGLLYSADDEAATNLAAACGDFMAQQQELLAQVRRQSHLAPAAWEGSGVDESVLLRGNAKTPVEIVPRRFLEAIAGPEQPPIERGSGRLQLAQRMTDPSNPLISRVIVNRVWQHLFGRGIVPSVDNLGVLGEAPSHPELLDFLAGEFLREGWSIKRLVRSIVLSSTYRMSSRSDAAADSADPTNRLFHRVDVRRLEGEAIRDSILAISGRLDPTPFGPSVPVHLTEFMEGRGRPESGPVDGGGRRSIYLAVRRNFLQPMFLAFDFPVPFTAIGRRTVSNVPAQALTLMNDPFVIAESRRWAERALAQAGKSPEERIAELYLAAFARPPRPDELDEAVTFLNNQSQQYGTGPEDPRAWADLCHVLFNVKEFIYVD